MFCHILNTMYKMKSETMEMTKLDCIYIERFTGDKNAIETELQTIGGIRVGIVRQMVKEKIEQSDKNEDCAECNRNKKLCKQDKALFSRIKKLCDGETVVVANERMVRDFDIPNILFEMKKQELLENKTSIIEYLRRQLGKEKRKKFLLTIESEKWNQNEIREILQMVKNHYENIYIYNRTGILDTDDLAKFFYEEYGLVLHFIDDLQMRKLKIDTALFLVKYWKEERVMACCHNGYVVAEFDNHQKRRRKRLHDMRNTKEYIIEEKKEIYMGFVHSYCGKQIPYELAVTMKNHVYLQHLLKLNKPQNEISIVAIYGAEWYN